MSTSGRQCDRRAAHQLLGKDTCLWDREVLVALVLKRPSVCPWIGVDARLVPFFELLELGREEVLALADQGLGVEDRHVVHSILAGDGESGDRLVIAVTPRQVPCKWTSLVHFIDSIS